MATNKLFAEDQKLNIFSALQSAKIGGTSDTLALIAIMGSFACALGPLPAWIDNQGLATSVAIKGSILMMSGLATFKIVSSALSDYRKQFILKSTCQTESSDLPNPPFVKSGLQLGFTTDTGESLYLSDDELTRHALITGQTGMGKSVFGKYLMYQQIQRGGGLLFVDGKLDEDNIQDIFEFACHCGRRQDFLVINPGQPHKSNTYNPILYGDADEVASRLLSLIPDTSGSAGADHYKQSANQALTAFVGALKETGFDYNFSSLSFLTMNEPALESLMNLVQTSSPDSHARKNLAMFLDQYSRDNIMDGNTENIHIDLKKLKDVLGGIGSRMHQFGTGSFGQVLNSFNPEVKMYDAIRDGKIVYVALPTMGKDVAAQNLGKMIISDLRTSISWLQLNKDDRPKLPFLAFMDELASYSTENLSVMFEQARSARVTLIGAIQTDSGLTNISEDFKERVMANCETKIYFKLSSDQTALAAEAMAGLTRRIMSAESSGETSSSSAQSLDVGPQKNSSAGSSNQTADREQEEAYIPADKFKGLDAGECIVIRGRSVWNIRVPFLSLSKELKESIGPIKINHIKQYKKPNEQGRINRNFDPMSQVDKYLEQSRNRRIVKKKDSKEKIASEPIITNSDESEEIMAEQSNFTEASN